MTPQLKKNRGFTLIEVTIAIGVLAFAVVPVIGLMSVAFDTNRGAAISMAQTLIRQTALAELRSIPIDDIAIGTNSDRFFDVQGRLGELSDPAFTPHYRLIVETTSDARFETDKGGTTRVNLLQAELRIGHPAPNYPNESISGATLSRR